jgi:hypothetical protein
MESLKKDDENDVIKTIIMIQIADNLMNKIMKFALPKTFCYAKKKKKSYVPSYYLMFYEKEFL